MLFETSNLFYNFSPAQDRQVTAAAAAAAAAKAGEENYRYPNFSALLDSNTSTTTQIKNLVSDTDITVDKRSVSSKEGIKEIGSPISNDFYYKHKLILAKKAFSSNSNSPVQSHQELDCSLPLENSPRNSNQSTEEISPSPVSSPARHHLNQSTERMGLCAESSANREQESRVAGSSRAEEEEDETRVKRSHDEEGDGFPNSGSSRRYFRSDDEEDGEEEEDDDDEEERRRPRLPDLLPHISSLERQKQLFKEHLLQKYFETCKNFPSNSSNSGSNNSLNNNSSTQDNIFGEQRHIFKQEPLDTYHPHRQQPQELPQLAPPPFGMDSQLSKFYPFPLPHPSLAQQQQQLLYEFSQMKMQKEKKLKAAQEKRNVFCCHICSFVGSSEDDFNSHMSQHFEHQCPHCTYSSRTEGRLKRHVKDFHSNENDSIYTGQQKAKSSTPKRTCRYCKFYTYDQVEFWVHLKKHIKPEKLLECPHCEFVTELKHHLEYHIRVHIGSKPFKCPKCNYSCVNKSMLNSHMKSHTNVYQFRCRDCNYATKYSHSLKLHLLKKKHHADVVLNSDGSLPTDGSGHFDVASRRGPPRGPRVVRARPLTSYSPTLSLNESSAFAPEAGGRIIAHLDDLRVRALQDRDSMMWSDMRQSRSPSEMSGTSRDDHFPIDIHHASANNNLANSFSTYARMMSTRNPLQQQFNCSFCVDRFPSSNLLTEHVESVHLKSAFGSYTMPPETSSASLLYPSSNLGKSFDIPTAKSEPIMEGFDEKVPCESSVTPLDLSSGPKRKPTEDADSRNTFSPASEHGSSRKRARKGRAFKLNPDRVGHNESWSVEDGVDSQATDDILLKENDERTEEEKGKPLENGQVEKTTVEVAASSSSDEAAVSAAVTAVVKSSPQWKHHDDAVVDTSPKSDSSGETVLHLNDEQKQVPTSASSAASSTQKDIKYGDLKVDSSWHICRHCEMAFADQMTHRLHMGYHGFYNPFQCNGCGENCVDAFDFMLHLMCKAHN